MAACVSDSYLGVGDVAGRRRRKKNTCVSTTIFLGRFLGLYLVAILVGAWVG